MIKEILIQVIAGGIIGLLLSFFLYYFIPKMLIKHAKGDPEKIDAIFDSIKKLQDLKAKFDVDTINEDIVERILRYAALSVMAAKQQLDDDAKDKKLQNEERKKFAVNLTQKMLKEYKAKYSSNEDLTESEKEIIEGLIEASVNVDKNGRTETLNLGK